MTGMQAILGMNKRPYKAFDQVHLPASVIFSLSHNILVFEHLPPKPLAFVVVQGSVTLLPPQPARTIPGAFVRSKDK